MGLRLEKVEESRERSKLCAFNVDFQDINKIVAVVFHKPAETPHLDVYVGTVVIDRAECPGLKMGSVGVGTKFRSPLSRVSTVAGLTNWGLRWKTHAADAKIVSPDLASGSLLQKFRFEGGFTIDA